MTGPNALAFAVAQVGVASSGNELLAKAIDITKKATQAHGRESRGLVKLNGNILLFSLQKHPPTYPELTLL
jgi:hypothetical protein